MFFPMRITIKGLLVVSVVLVVTTSTLLWQCRPTSGAKSRASYGSNANDDSSDNRIIEKQNNRQPLMTDRQQRPQLEREGEGGYFDEPTGAALQAEGENSDPHRTGKVKEGSSCRGFAEIPCIINEGESVPCRKDDSDTVYVPFSFIHNYFEIYGRLGLDNLGNEVFEWSHSYSHFYEPSTPYKATGQFLNFDQFNVEARERVKCISAIEGVPISTQWEVSGYAYPIQIAQFGLSHFSKYLKDPHNQRVMLEDGRKHKARWRFENKSSALTRSFEPDINAYIFKFSTPENPSNKGVSLKLSESEVSNLLVLNMYLQLSCKFNSSISVGLQTQEKKSEVFFLHYTCSTQLIETQDRQIYHGLGKNKTWRRVTRNLMIDLLKGVAASPHPKKLRKHINKSKVKIVSIELRGRGRVANISLASAEHLYHFYDAADWLLMNQDDKGGWSIPVPRKVIPGVLEVEEGWYSAMAQGQAISLLIRAAYHSGEMKYLDAAAKATSLFSVNVTQGGIRTYFPGGFVWYEEYPTSPSMFVLNGFMYSLLGLYDLMQMKSAPANPSEILYEKGIRSLKTLLPLFDSGWGSLYDLRHFTVHVAPNLARWDYHTTHITQLLLLSTVESDGEESILLSTAKRWKNYMLGQRAKHN